LSLLYLQKTWILVLIFLYILYNVNVKKRTKNHIQNGVVTSVYYT